VEQQSKQQPDERQQKISELEAKLQMNHKIISNLQQNNLELQKQITDYQKNKDHQQLSAAEISEKSQQQNKQNMPKQRHTQAKKLRGKFVSKSQFGQLSDFQFYGIITLVVFLILGLFIFGQSIFSKNSNKKENVAHKSSGQPAKVVKSLPSLAVAPLNIPIENQTGLPINPNAQLIPSISESVYNVTAPTEFSKSDKLDKIVNNLVKYAQENQLPTESLSITLIDVKNKTLAGYKKDTVRYPASVVKLFWMVALEAQIKKALIPLDAGVNSDLNQMILKSDNDAASRILDRITGTQSISQTLEQEKFAEWQRRRQTVNLFFQRAGYKDINISQKTFPIPYLKITEPKGADLQIRGDNPQKPRRNKISTYQTARLMYEIFDYQAVGPEYSQQMIDLLTRDLRPTAWKREPPNLDEFNPIDNFFGESLATEPVLFASKAGWTTASRQEVAYVATPNGKARYILAIFGDDPAYGKSKTIFPQMSRIVFDSMTKSK
jgi:beta-lactamase class A